MEVEINLLPIKKKSVPMHRKWYMLIVALFLVGIIAIAATKYLSMAEISRLTAEKAVLENQMSELEKGLQQSSGEKQDMEVIKEIDDILANRVRTSSIVKPLLEKLPNGTSMLNISYTNEGSVTVLTRSKTITGVSAYQSKLLETEGIEGVFLEKLSRTNGQEGEKLAESQSMYYADLMITYDRALFAEGGTEN